MAGLIKVNDLEKGKVFSVPGTEIWRQSSTVISDRGKHHTHGDLIGGASQSSEGIVLASTTQMTTFANTDQLNFGDGVNDRPFTVNLWIKPSVDVQHSKWILYKKEEWGIYSWNTVGEWMMFQIRDQGNGNRTRQCAIDLPHNEWSMLTATYDGRGTNNPYLGMLLWFNGIVWPVHYTGGLAGTYTAMQDRGLDSYIGFATNTYQGTYNNVEVWDRDLNTAEVWALYERGRAR